MGSMTLAERPYGTHCVLFSLFYRLMPLNCNK